VVVRVIWGSAETLFPRVAGRGRCHGNPGAQAEVSPHCTHDVKLYILNPAILYSTTILVS
jgi:hypothetical protein